MVQEEQVNGRANLALHRDAASRARERNRWDLQRITLPCQSVILRACSADPEPARLLDRSSTDSYGDGPVPVSDGKK